MVAYNKVAKDIVTGLEKKLNDDKLFKKLFNIYNNYSKNPNELNPIYNQLSDKYKQFYNAKAAEGNADLIRSGRYPSSFKDTIDYELNKIRPYKSLTVEELTNIDNQVDQLAKQNYLDNFNSINDAEDYYKNELIYNLTGRDRNRLTKEKELSKLNRQQLEDYSTNEYNLPKLENNDVVDLNNDGIYNDYVEEIMKSSDEFKNSLEAEIINQQLKDEFNQRYLQQMEDYDNMLSTGGFNEPVKHINNPNYKVRYTKSKASFFDPNDKRRFNNLFDEIEGQDIYDGFNYDDF